MVIIYGFLDMLGNIVMYKVRWAERARIIIRIIPNIVIVLSTIIRVLFNCLFWINHSNRLSIATNFYKVMEKTTTTSRFGKI